MSVRTILLKEKGAILTVTMFEFYFWSLISCCVVVRVMVLGIGLVFRLI